MSYKALYRKYRPQSLSDVVGQDHIVSTLRNIIESKKIGHAYLFSGPRGTGKTSIAHVFAREINRDLIGKVIANEMDIVEIDAASNNGVAEIRSIIETSRYAPTEAKFKVYIIDEVHMLTKGAFNAFLKTLEEPPHHVVFILATTEAHKIPITILSRVQRFNFNRIENKILEKRLKDVLVNESISYDEEAIKTIAKLSQGGLRDALSIADQIAAYGNGKISIEMISRVLGVTSLDNLISLLNKISNHQAKEMLIHVNNFIEQGADIERITISLLEIVKDFIIYKKTQDMSLLENLNQDHLANCQFTLSFAYDVLDVLVKLLSELRFSMIPRQSFELALLKLINVEVGEKLATNDKKVNHAVEPKPQIIQETKIVKEEIKLDFEVKEEVKPVEPKVSFVDRDIVVEKVNVSEKEIETILTQDMPKTFEEHLAEATQDIDLLQTQVFTTAELNLKQSSMKELKHYDAQLKAKEQELKNKIINTDELNLVTQNVTQETEIKTHENKMMEDVLTQINEPMKMPNNANHTQEESINILSMFDTVEMGTINEKTKSAPAKINTGDIINLLVQTNKELTQTFKWKIENISMFTGDAIKNAYVTLLNRTKIIASNEGFILLTCEDKAVVYEINKEAREQTFIDFIFEIFKFPLLAFAITKEEFDDTKRTWQELARSESLPQPREIEKVIPSENKKSEAEQLGTNIFGDLFG